VDQREWGLLRETVVRKTQASGASREDAEDATHDALLAAIRQPQHPQSEVAWLSTVAKRRRVDLIRQRAREQQVTAAAPGAADPTAAGPEDVVVERAHASWLAASLTQLPATTREVVDAVGAGMAPSEVASSMNMSPRSVESHLTRARRHLRRMGALALPLGALLGWTLRARPAGRVVPAAMAVAAVPVVVAVVALMPSSHPLRTEPHAAPAAPARVLPEPRTVPAPRDLPAPAPAAVPPAPAAPAAAAPDAGTADRPGLAENLPGGGRPGDPVAAGAGVVPPESGRPGAQPPESRALPPPQCPLRLPVLGDVGCVLVHLVNGVVQIVSGHPQQLPEVLPAG
jgi:RNA polymerase sigma factor (sigma-70 family)